MSVETPVCVVLTVKDGKSLVSTSSSKPSTAQRKTKRKGDGGTRDHGHDPDQGPGHDLDPGHGQGLVLSHHQGDEGLTLRMKRGIETGE